MSITEASAPPMGEIKKPRGYLIDEVRAEREAFCRDRFVSQFAKETHFDEAQTHTNHLREFGQFDANLGAGFERFNLQPQIEKGVVKLEKMGYEGEARVNVRLADDMTADDVARVYNSDPKTNLYRSAINEVKRNFRDSDILASYSTDTFRLFEDDGQPKDRDFLLTVTSANLGTYTPYLKTKPDPPLSLLETAEEIAAAQVGVLEKNIAGLPHLHDVGQDAPVQGEGFYVDSEGNLTKVLFKTPVPGKFVGLKVAGEDTHDLRTQEWQIGYEYDPMAGNEERGNGTDFLAPPFIESACAQELLGSFESVGLELSEHTKKVFAESNNEKRYGQAYAELTREICKVIGQPDTKSVTELFGGSGDEVLQALDAMQPEDIGYSAALIVDLLKQLADRELAQASNPSRLGSDLPVTTKSINIKDGACKDAENYYTSSTTHKVNIGGKAFLTKTEGVQTYMNIDPVIFNGIKMQPGVLFGKQKDGSFGVLRYTSYAVGEEAPDTFGVQYKEVVGDDPVIQMRYHRVEDYIQHR